MKNLIKIMLILALLFSSTFLIAKLTGLLSIEQIERWLNLAKEISPLYVGAIVTLLLFSDLFIAVPTLTVTILSGYFLGFHYGFLSALLGMVLAGGCGYFLSRIIGERIVFFLVKDKIKIDEMKDIFSEYGFSMILLSRSVPILPEVTACLSGMTGMPFKRFLLAWLINSVPYALLASYAGSISSLENPKPAIFAAIGISVFLWSGWYLRKRKSQNQKRT